MKVKADIIVSLKLLRNANLETTTPEFAIFKAYVLCEMIASTTAITTGF